MTELELSPTVFSIFNALIEERVGLHYDLLDREIFQQKAAGRALEAGFESLLDYYYYLRYDEGSGVEFKALVETLVVNETYFFREWPAVEMLVNEFIAPACAAGQRSRIWSAACATGEEPLSLAMLLDDRGLLNQVEIVASDISERVLAKAQSGHFGKRSVRSVPMPRLSERYLTPEPNGYAIARPLVDAIQWRNVNLLSPPVASEAASFDIILCRNVLIYFADETVLRVLGKLMHALKPTGALIVGVSESLLRFGSGLDGEEVAGSFVYRMSRQ